MFRLMKLIWYLFIIHSLNHINEPPPPYPGDVDQNPNPVDPNPLNNNEDNNNGDINGNRWVD